MAAKRRKSEKTKKYKVTFILCFLRTKKRFSNQEKYQVKKFIKIKKNKRKFLKIFRKEKKKKGEVKLFSLFGLLILVVICELDT